MPITLKTPDEIESMRYAGRLANEVLDMIGSYVQPGITTNEIDRICHDYIVNVQKAFPSPLYYKGYPKSICTSVNHQVCHGVPGDKVLKEGDIINIDATVMKNGYHGDTSRMYSVGKTSIIAKRLIEVAYECLWAGISQVKPGNHLGDVGYAIQRHADSKSFAVVRDYCGHGIGRDFHEDPQVLHHADKRGEGDLLCTGMTFTIEPMVNAGKCDVKLLPDGWTVVTKDHKLSAQWEHTVAVTKEGVDVLTFRTDEKIPQVITANYRFSLFGFRW